MGYVSLCITLPSQNIIKKIFCFTFFDTVLKSALAVFKPSVDGFEEEVVTVVVGNDAGIEVELTVTEVVVPVVQVGLEFSEFLFAVAGK